MKDWIQERLMKFPVTHALCACLGLSIGFGQRVDITPKTVKPSTRLQLQVEVDPPTAGPGAQVFAKLRLKNVSPTPVSLDDSFPENDFRLTVVDVSGREPTRTEWGEKLIHGPLVVQRVVLLSLQPGGGTAGHD
jgi:hypothetical protein